MMRRSILCLALIPIVAAAQGPGEIEAVITTALGPIRIEFAPEKAPKHVAAFLERVKKGYYDGSGFFRVVANGIVQGGDPGLKNPKTPRKLWGTGGLSLLASEISDLKHERGTVSTVRIPDRPNSDGAQFFICVSPQPALDGQFSAFGRVTEGMDLVTKISQSSVGADGFTEVPVRIEKITIEPKKKEPFAGVPVSELRRVVKLRTTLGVIRVQMEPEWAPETVRNFLKLTETGWYNGTGFHRIAKGFVIQGGMEDSREDGGGHPADRWVREIKGEFRADLKHERGILSMARAEDPDSATTSFFVVLGAAAHLDGKYAAFGRVIEGLEVLDLFEKEEVEGESPKRRLEVIEAVIER